ncbi:MAG: COX15/CtaA family protein [Leptospirales bacterium]|jgi:cytochrome c oxidase assembly protein subunit 15
MDLVLFRRLTLIVIVSALLTMVLGPLVRAAEAGLACPDWPLCKGEIIPDVSDYQVFLEWFHRLVGGVTALALLAWVYLLARRRELRERFLFWGLLAIALMITQILLGALTITEQLDAYVVKSHLLNALLFLSVLVYIHRKIGRILHDTPRVVAAPDRISQAAAGVFLVALFLQLFLGGRVSTNHAGLVCPAFPACYHEQEILADGTQQSRAVYFPPMIGNIEKHITHRLMAYALTFGAIGLVLLGGRRNWLEPGRRLSYMIFSAIVVQIIVGVINVLYRVPIGVTVLHSAVAYFIYLSSFILWLELTFDRQRAN